MILMIDNFDSFTYNIVQYLQMLGQEVVTLRNDQVSIKDIIKLKPTHLVVSPGPGTPKEAGISIEAIKYFAGKIPILGVCLGHQAIVEAFGGKIIQAARIVHGKKEPISHDERGLFRNVPNNFQAVRYHSLAGERKTLPACLEITATSSVDNEIMGLRHKEYLIEGVQFHPESIGTEHGLKLLENFLKYKRTTPQKINLLRKISFPKDLSYEEAYQLMDEITSGELSESQLGACLGMLAVKGISPEELSAFATVLRDKTGINKYIPGLLDTCGTGGDGKHTFNISTAAALVCASLGVKVAKHGNRAITSQSGSYDFLNALGIKTDNNLKDSIQAINDNNFAFLFAPLYHKAMKHVAKVRQEVKIRTVFNMIGPLANPLKADYQLIGVFSNELIDVFAETLKLLKLKRALVVHSADGLDEISICAKTHVRELTKTGDIKQYELTPEEFGLSKYTIDDISGGTAQENADLFKEICKGKPKTRHQNAITDAVSLNAGAGLYISGKASSILEGYKLAKEHLVSGKMKI